jgi:Tfp pilus assembly pilus retraction ATPase PilT
MSASDFRLVDWTQHTPIPEPPSFLQAIASEMLEKRLLRARLDPHAKAWLQQARQWRPAESQTISSSSLLEQLEAILNPAIRSQLERDEHARVMLTVSPEKRLLVELFRELDGPSCLLSLLPAQVPEADSLGLPAALLELLQRRSGILILAAPPGNGLSTTLAVCAQRILNNDNRLLLYVGHNPMLSPHGRLCVMPHERAQLEPGPIASNACTSKRSPIWHSHFDVLLADDAHGELSAELIESASTRLVIMSSQSLSLSSACEALLAHTPLSSQSYLRHSLAQRVIGHHAQVLCQSRENQPVLASTLTIPTPAVRVLLEHGWNAPTSALFTAIETMHQKSTISDQEREHWRQQLLNEVD